MSGSEYHSTFKNRVYKRKFDWDEAKRLRRKGWLQREIAEHFGVSTSAVALALSPRQRSKMRAYARQWVTSAVCEDCGEPCTRRKGRLTGMTLCLSCANDRRYEGVRVRDTDAGGTEARCSVCSEWKGFAAFPSNRSERWGIHGVCRACQTAVRRKHREKTRVPCSHGCGTMVDRNPNKEPECLPCALHRIHSARQAA